MTILELYAKASESYRLPRNEEAGMAWEEVLSPFSMEEIEGAIATHRADTTLDERGRPRGCWMPLPAELKLLIETGRKKAAQGSPLVFCGQCTEGWIPDPDRPEERRLRRCPCFARWVERRKASVGVCR
jgi:hypothetical protein